MAIEFRIDDRKLGERIANSPAHAKQFLDSLSEAIIAQKKLSMQQTKKGGRGRRRTKSGKQHFPSLPGYPPAIDFGNLINSLHYEAKGNDREFYGAEYGLTLDQERNRPFIEKGIKAVQERDLDNIAKAVWGE